MRELPAWTTSFVLWGNLVEFWVSIGRKFWCRGILEFQPFWRASIAGICSKWFAEFLSSMLRNVLLQRGRLAARRVIQEGRRHYIPEVQFSSWFDDETISGTGSDRTALHAFVLILFFDARASSLEGSIRLLNKFGRSLGVNFLKMLLSCNC